MEACWKDDVELLALCLSFIVLFCMMCRSLLFGKRLQLTVVSAENTWGVVTKRCAAARSLAPEACISAGCHAAGRVRVALGAPVSLVEWAAC